MMTVGMAQAIAAGRDVETSRSPDGGTYLNRDTGQVFTLSAPRRAEVECFLEPDADQPSGFAFRSTSRG